MIHLNGLLMNINIFLFYFLKQPKFRNFVYLESIMNFYFSSNSSWILQLPMQAVPITSDVVSSILDQCAEYNIM